MTGVDLPGEDRVPAGPVRDLVLALHELYQGAGNPSLREISDRTAERNHQDRVSHTTIEAMLRGDRPPRWNKWDAVVRVLAAWNGQERDPDAEAQRIKQLWHAAQGHSDLDETARDLARTPAVRPPASGITEAPADPAQWEFSEQPTVSSVLPHSAGRSARQFPAQPRRRLRSPATRWRLAAVVFVTVAGVITGPGLTGGSVTSEGFQITAAVNGNQPEAFTWRPTSFVDTYIMPPRG